MSDLGNATWADEILDFLTLRGAVIFSNWSPKSASDLASHLSTESWTALVVRNLLSSQTFCSHISALRKAAGRSVESVRSNVTHVSRARLHGRPDMRATLRKRVRSRDDTLWVSKRAEKRWQSELNGAVVGFFDFLLKSTSRFTVATTQAEYETLAEIRKLISSEPLRHVSPDPNWRSVTFDPRILAKSTFYRTLSHYMNAARWSLRTRETTALRNELRGWLRSEDDDRLFELFVLTVAIRVLRGLIDWNSFEINIDAPFGYVTAVADGVTCEIRFDRALQGGADSYSKIVRQYAQISGNQRRPDVHFNIKGAVERILLLEAKNTFASTQYARDSVFKALGYLANYRERWANTDTLPKIILALSSTVGARSQVEERLNEDIIVADPSSLSAELEIVLRALIA